MADAKQIIRARAPAKVNLWLRVLAREDNGYHQLETVFCALELHDDVEIVPCDELRLDVRGAELGPVADNLVMRAARAFFSEMTRRTGADARDDEAGDRHGRGATSASGPPTGAEITLTKRIPAGAGLGGGSSDAAATLRALNRLCGAPLDRSTLLRIGERLGSDVPFFLSGAALALGWGRGERLLALDALPARDIVVAVPEWRVSTPAGFDRLDEYRSAHPSSAPGGTVLTPDELRAWDDIAGRAANDFEAALFERNADLRALRDTLRDGGARPALVSGSGSAVFGVFSNRRRADEAGETVRDGFPAVDVIRTANARGHPRAGSPR